MSRLFSFTFFFMSLNQCLCALDNKHGIHTNSNNAIILDPNVRLTIDDSGIWIGNINKPNESVELIGSQNSLTSRVTANEDSLNQITARLNQTEERLDLHDQQLSILVTQTSSILEATQQQGRDLTDAILSVGDGLKQTQASVNTLSQHMNRLLDNQVLTQSAQSKQAHTLTSLLTRTTNERLDDKRLQQNLIQENMQTTKKAIEATSQALAKLSESQATTKKTADKTSRRLNQVENKLKTKDRSKLEREGKRLKAQVKQGLSFFSDKADKEALRLSKKLL
jgi:chromosome segregation ATPase